MRRTARLALLSALALGGCVFGDCRFETAQTRTVGGVVLADGRGLGDTLTVAFLRTTSLRLDVTVDDGVGVEPDPTPDEVVELLYDSVALSASGDRVPRQLVATARGDTVYVYVVGTIDPLSFACSPAETGVSVHVRDLLVPEGVVAARVVVVDAAALPEPAAAALRQTDAARRAARTIHI